VGRSSPLGAGHRPHRHGAGLVPVAVRVQYVRMRTSPATLGLLSYLLLLGGTGRSRTQVRIDAGRLAELVDSVMQSGMAEEKIPGAAVLIMDHGRVILDRGYGVAEVATKRKVDPHSTLWPFASITKVVTATALMQLVERGRIGLDIDVNHYLKVARVPAHPGPDVTARHLLTHTDALDELPGRQAESREALQPLAQFLRTRLALAGSPGRVTRYGTYGIALAGVLIEDVSGVPYAEYLRRELFAPLKMRHATIDVPPDDRGAFATPYERTREGVRVARYEWYQTTPTSSLVSTVDDMARFMALHLESAQPGAGRLVLTSAAIRDMAAQHASVHPAIPGWGYGWQQNDANGRHIIEHGGDIGGFASLMTLLPDERFGIIVVHHLEGSNLRFVLKRAIMNRFFPDRRAPSQARPAARDLSAYTGTYLANNYCRSCPGGAENAQRFSVTADSGWLRLWDDRWGEIDPLLFVSEDGRRRIGFMKDSTGTIVALSAGAWRVLERAPATGSQDDAQATADSAGIRNTALDYIEGWYSGDGPRMERALHPDLAKRIVTTDSTGQSRLSHTGALALVQSTRRGGGSAISPPERRQEVTILDIYGGAASVRIRASSWVDYLHLAKFNGRWVIVNVLWERDPPGRTVR
jgi:CubicO group peptidase (beta-lactamase class C family)